MEGEWDKSLRFKTCTTVLVMSLSSASVAHHVQRCSVTTTVQDRVHGWLDSPSTVHGTVHCTV